MRGALTVKSAFESFDDIVCEKVESESCMQPGTLYERLWLNTTQHKCQFSVPPFSPRSSAVEYFESLTYVTWIDCEIHNPVPIILN